MAAQMTPKAKKFIKLLFILAIVGGGIYYANSKGLLDRVFKKSVTVAGIDLGTAPPNAKESNLQFLPLPSSTVSTLPPKYGRAVWKMMEWNAQFPIMYANGGVLTTQGSLLEKYGVSLTLGRQDDDSQLVTEMIKFGKAYHDNPNTTDGFFFSDMGDGSMALLQSMNSELIKLGPDYIAEVIGATGFSKGEDALLVPVSWRENPQKAKGSVISTVLRNGDYNIALLFGQLNQIPVNNDEHTYNPNAINFLNASDFQQAGEKYISNYKETRPIVDDNGKKIGGTKEIEVTGVATWTPVDVNIAEKRGGLIKILSTKDNQAQMPCVIFTIKKYAQEHKEQIEAIIKASTDGADQIMSFTPALEFAGDVSAKVYKDKDGAFWTKLATGYSETDKQGLQVDLGGSGFYNLADNLNTFGITGSANNFGIVYNSFSKKYQEYFPELYKTGFPKLEDILDLTFLSDLKNSKDVSKTGATTASFSKSVVTQTVGLRPWNIQFATGQSNLTEEGKKTVDEIYDALSISNKLKIELYGHTDAQGSDAINQPLSEARANAVKNYLQAKSIGNFPDSRFTSIKGFGGSQPIADNNTASGRAQNRRVVVKVGN